MLTLVGKGCKMTPSSCRAVSTRWGYCLGLEPVSYMDIARPPRGGCRPKGPWSCCCPLGVCHRSVVFSVCKEFSWREQNIFQFICSWGLISLQKPQPDINNRGEYSLQERSDSFVSSSLPPSFQSCPHNKRFVSQKNEVLTVCVDNNI